jgi:hypothetical protein
MYACDVRNKTKGLHALSYFDAERITDTVLMLRNQIVRLLKHAANKDGQVCRHGKCKRFRVDCLFLPDIHLANRVGVKGRKEECKMVRPFDNRIDSASACSNWLARKRSERPGST